MTLGEFLDLARLFVPGAKKNQVTDDQLKIVLNAGALDIVSFTRCLDRVVYFDLVDGQQEYLLSDVAPDFLSMDDEGIWVYDGSRYKKCYPKTRKWLDEEYINWRGAGESTPIYYYQEENAIGFYKTPSTSRTNGALMYTIRKPETMVENTDVAFHVYGDKKTEISSLSVLNESVLDYTKWKLSEPLSKPLGEIISRRGDYYSAMKERMKRIKKRADINKDGDTKRRQRPSWAIRGSYR